MQLLEQRIMTDGEILPGGILKVDGFLNHQMDPQLLTAMGEEFHRLFDGMGVNKILTIEGKYINCTHEEYFDWKNLQILTGKIMNVKIQTQWE